MESLEVRLIRDCDSLANSAPRVLYSVECVSTCVSHTGTCTECTVKKVFGAYIQALRTTGSGQH